jgi:CPA2 family monovalent cation:H+ antiporter-2
LAGFTLEDIGVRLLSLRRSDGKLNPIVTGTLLQECDTLVLSGKADMLALAEQRLLKGASALRAQSNPSH